MSDHWAQKRGMSYLLRALETHVTWNFNYKTLNLHWIYILTYSGGCSVPAGIEFVYLLHTKSLKGWWWNKYNSWYTGLCKGSEWGRILYLLHCTACHHLGKGQIIYNKGFLGSTLKIHHTNVVSYDGWDSALWRKMAPNFIAVNSPFAESAGSFFLQYAGVCRFSPWRELNPAFTSSSKHWPSSRGRWQEVSLGNCTAPTHSPLNLNKGLNLWLPDL